MPQKLRHLCLLTFYDHFKIFGRVLIPHKGVVPTLHLHAAGSVDIAMASVSDGSMTILVLHHRHGSMPTAASAMSAEFNIIPYRYESLKIPIFEKKTIWS